MAAGPQATAEAGSDTLEDGRLGELETRAAELEQRLLRTAADFDNYRKRARQEQLETARYAAQEVMLRLIPVVDDLRRGLEQAPPGSDEGWIKGMELAVQKLEETLAEHGLRPVEAVGRKFDPAFHEAIGTEESVQHPEDMVVTELRRGYRLHDRVVRPALVRVSRRPA
jgi:molecular chaperone GrpE